MHNGTVLLRTLFLSTSGRNSLKYETDSKKRGKVIAGYVGYGILFFVLFFYCVLLAVGYGTMGLTRMIPAMCALTIIAMAFLFTLLKTNGYLFAFREYDMLVALPFSIKTIVSSKFLYMYAKNLLWVSSISLSMMIGYGIYEKPGILCYVVWVILSLFLPVLPMVLASAIGALIAGIGSAFKHKQLVQTILTFAFVLLAFGSQYVIQNFFRNEEMTYNTLSNMSEAVDKIGTIMLPVKWFEHAVCSSSVSAMALLVIVSVAVYEVFFWIISKFYRRINTKLMSGQESSTKVKAKQISSKSVLNSIAYKEWKRLTNSTIYFTNTGVGILLVLILSIAVCFVDVDRLLAVITEGSPITKTAIIAGIPFIIYFFVGMCATTACSFSLEGKSYWIVQSLPLSMQTLVKGKMLFHLYFSVPVTVIGNTSLCIACGGGVVNTLMCNLCGLILCCFSTVWGMRCNLKHVNMEWENEVEVVKQGAAVTIYLFPNMIGCMIILVLAIAAETVMMPTVVLLLVSAVVGLLAYLLYRNVMSLCKAQRAAS